MQAFRNDPRIRNEYINVLSDLTRSGKITQYHIEDKTEVETRKNGLAESTVDSKYFLKGGLEFEVLEHKLGMPVVLFQMQDKIFDGLSPEEAPGFPLQFVSAIPLGADLVPVWKKMLVWLLTDPIYGVLQHSADKQIIQDTADAHLQDSIKPLRGRDWGVIFRKLEKLRDSDRSADIALFCFYTGFLSDFDRYSPDSAFAEAALLFADKKCHNEVPGSEGRESVWYTAARKKFIQLIEEAVEEVPLQKSWVENILSKVQSVFH